MKLKREPTDEAKVLTEAQTAIHSGGVGMGNSLEVDRARKRRIQYHLMIFCDVSTLSSCMKGIAENGNYWTFATCTELKRNVKFLRTHAFRYIQYIYIYTVYNRMYIYIDLYI